ncbi:MAG: YcxB family protein [Clostridium sp.]
MQELNYQLTKEDYFDWIHWNVGRQNLKKMKITTAVIYGAFLIFYLGSSIAQKKDPASLLSTLILVLVLGGFMFYVVSAKHQERVIWKRSGLKKLEKTTGFPKVCLIVREDGVTMEIPDQVHKDYPYTDILQLEETNRLFLLGASDKTWQFVAKSGFTSQEQMDEFKTFIEEKIADAKENPEKYRKAEVKEISDSDEDGETQDGDSCSADYSTLEEDGAIEPMDTSNMGKIGKMAHIMAAMAAEVKENEESSEDLELSEDLESSEAETDKTENTDI